MNSEKKVGKIGEAEGYPIVYYSAETECEGYWLINDDLFPPENHAGPFETEAEVRAFAKNPHWDIDVYQPGGPYIKIGAKLQ